MSTPSNPRRTPLPATLRNTMARLEGKQHQSLADLRRYAAAQCLVLEHIERDQPGRVWADASEMWAEVEIYRNLMPPRAPARRGAASC